MIKRIDLSRRKVVKSVLTGISAIYALPVIGKQIGSNPDLKGNFRHSVSKWCFKYPMDEFCKEVKKIGIESVEMVGPDKWPVILKNGLDCAVANFPDLSPERGFNNQLWHANLFRSYAEVIPLAAKVGIKKIICYAGNISGLSDQEGFENCKKLLREILPVAETNKVTLVMELIGKEFPDYQCNNVKWGVNLCDSLQSENFKLLYDVANMYSVGADINSDIKQFHPYIAHYQIAGFPNRCEPDISKELDCRKVLDTIKGTGYKDFVGQEYWPSREIDRMKRLGDCINFCDI